MSKRLKRLIERRQAATLWGKRRFVTPRLVDRVFGDGKKLVAVSPLNTRPNYYVVRVDSGCELSNHVKSDAPKLIDLLHEELYYEIELQFGLGWCAECDSPFGENEGCEDCKGERAEKFPALDLTIGSEWWEIDWPGRAMSA